MHIENNAENNSPNIKTDNESVVNIYIKNAIALSQTLAIKGYRFILITNDRDYISTHFPNSLETVEIEFTTKLSKQSSFYSAHFKLDAFKYLSNLCFDYVCFLDIDIVCINEMPLNFKNAACLGIPLYYDISSQVIPVYGEQRIASDISLIRGKISLAKWAGGELLAGKPEFFATLVEEIEMLFPKYINCIDKVHHVGDEMFTNAALQNLLERNLAIQDSGSLGVIRRYWSSNTLHKQEAFAHFENSFLIHLPADKRFIASYLDNGNSFSLFLKSYKKYLVRRKIVNLGKSIFELVIKMVKK